MELRDRHNQSLVHLLNLASHLANEYATKEALYQVVTVNDHEKLLNEVKRLHNALSILTEEVYETKGRLEGDTKKVREQVPDDYITYDDLRDFATEVDLRSVENRIDDIEEKLSKLEQ